jgi:predicted lactoylglutathione lyase
MTTDLWLNLPVVDLDRSVAFYEAIGFKRNPGPGNTQSSASFVVGEKKVVLMLFAKAVFGGFVGGVVADPSLGSEMLISIGASDAAEVDDIAKRAVGGGGSVYATPSQAGGQMYGCGLCDPDGHRWNVLFMGRT